MAETPKYAVENQLLGCGFVGAIFHRGIFRPRKSMGQPPLLPASIKNPSKVSTVHGANRRRGGSDSMARLESSESTNPLPKVDGENPIKKPPLGSPKPSNAARSSTSSSANSNSSSNKLLQLTNSDYTKRPRKEPSISSVDLSLTISGCNHKNSASTTLFKASSGNVMLLGRLGNLKQPSTKTSEAKNHTTVRKCGESRQLGNVSRGLTGKIDPEVLKSMGNEKYKEGRFDDALALYNQAIAIDSSKASYYSNKSAALMGLGRLMEAALESREAARIEPSYHNAHYRLARLYLRLGEAGKALDHYKCSGNKAGTEEIAQAEALKACLSSCTEARKLNKWKTLLKESQRALSSGADSSPKVYAMQAEALLRLHRHDDAYAVMRKCPNFDVEHCKQLIGSADTAYFLTIQSQVYLTAGRFEDAVATAHYAARVDSSSYEVKTMAQRAEAVTMARMNGNRLFKAYKFTEACGMYSEGLELEPNNSILLCNRAACRLKLGKFEKAVDDCTIAVHVRPSYSKAGLRRAECNAKLERWEAAIQDYEALLQEMPRDEGIVKALMEARVQMKEAGR